MAEVLNEGIQVFKGSVIFKKALKTMDKQIRKGKTSKSESKKIIDLLQDGYEKFKKLEDKYELANSPEEKKKLKEEYSKLKKEYLSKTERAKKAIKNKGANKEVTNARLIGAGIAANIIVALLAALGKLLSKVAIAGVAAAPVLKVETEIKHFNY